VKFLLVLLLLTAAIYVVVRLSEQRSGRGGSFGARLRRPAPRPDRPLGPDDDPEFLRDLNRRKKRHEED
jgi:hypothetical protein